MPQKYRDGNPPGISRCYGTKEANSVVCFDVNLMNRLMGDGTDFRLRFHNIQQFEWKRCSRGFFQELTNQSANIFAAG
jgi:hypothetical protein